MSKTLREWLESCGPLGEELARTGGGLDYFTDILDATVYGLCETCGGSKKCYRCEGRGWYRGTPENSRLVDGVPPFQKVCDDCKGTGVCPDCTTVSVITKEAWEAFVLACDDTECLVGADDVRSTATAKQAATERWDYQGNDVSCHMDFETWWSGLEERATTILSTVLGKTRAVKAIGCITGIDVEFHSFDADGPLDGDNVVGDTIAILEDDDE